MAGPDARPRPDQVRAVEHLVEGCRRVLVVQATGWGKSGVLGRDRRAPGEGCWTHAGRLAAAGLDARSDRSCGAGGAAGGDGELDQRRGVGRGVGGPAIRADRRAAHLPERLSNPSFAAQLPELLDQCGLLVIDEAHCVSDWDFDFRPDYLRLTRTLLALAPGTPVLARYHGDCQPASDRRRGSSAGRGHRHFARLFGAVVARLAVVPQLCPLERYAWVAEALRSLPGSGIVYVLTVAETERVAGFLLEQGLKGLRRTQDRPRIASSWRIGCATTRSRRWSPPRRWDGL
jgi:ATP-dependent DNA helicase RecQ